MEENKCIVCKESKDSMNRIHNTKTDETYFWVCDDHIEQVMEKYESDGKGGFKLKNSPSNSRPTGALNTD